MTQGSDHVAEYDTVYDEDQGHVIGDVLESIAVGRTRKKNHVSLVGSLHI